MALVSFFALTKQVPKQYYRTSEYEAKINERF